LLALAAIAIASVAAGCLPDSFIITPVYTKPDLVERTLKREGLFAPKIALIDMDGIMVNERRSWLVSDGEHPVSFLLEKLDKAREDAAVKAVILRINSPGGSVVAAELMHDEIARFREETHKPVVAVMMDVAASGGYYVACACDEIAAHQSTVTGSIGVIMQLFDVTGTMAKLGITGHTIKSGVLKGGGSPFEHLSEQDRAVFQGIIDEMYERFVGVVHNGRPMLTEEKVRELADGRVYTARQALDLGLIDRIGTLDNTVELLKMRLSVPNVRLVTYGRETGYYPNIYASTPPAPSAAPSPFNRGSGDINIVNVELPSWLRTHPARFMYLWSP